MWGWLWPQYLPHGITTKSHGKYNLVLANFGSSRTTLFTWQNISFLNLTGIFYSQSVSLSVWSENCLDSSSVWILLFCYFIILEWNKYPRTAWEWAPAAFAANLQMNWPSLLHNISSGIMLRMAAGRNINNFTSVLMNTQSRCLRAHSMILIIIIISWPCENIIE